MPSEPSILEQISSKRRGAEIWLRDAGDYLRDYRGYLKEGRLSRDDAQEAIEVLDGLDGAGFAYFDDLDKLLDEASRLSASELRAAEPKFSRAKPILSRAVNVLDQIAALHTEIVSFDAALHAYAENRLTIREEHLILSTNQWQPPRLCDEVTNALTNSKGKLEVDIAEGTRRFCLPPCVLKSLNGPDAHLVFTTLSVREVDVNALVGAYYADSGVGRVNGTALTVHNGRVSSLTVGDIQVTGKLEVLESGKVVEHARGEGKIVGPKISNPSPNRWGRGWLYVGEKDPQLTLKGNVQIGTKGPRKIRDYARNTGERILGVAAKVPGVESAIRRARARVRA